MRLHSGSCCGQDPEADAAELLLGFEHKKLSVPFFNMVERYGVMDGHDAVLAICHLANAITATEFCCGSRRDLQWHGIVI